MQGDVYGKQAVSGPGHLSQNRFLADNIIVMELPVDFVNYTRDLLGAEAYESLERALRLEAVTSIRLNNGKLPGDYRIDESHSPVLWASSGYYLDNRLTFTFDPLFHSGCYYVQEASSMFVEQALRHYVKEPLVMLDLCAAPGGKSTHARSVLPEGSLLVCNEVRRGRARVLTENLVKWGHPGIAVTQNDPSDFSSLRHCFDVILADVPCSGEGMFRKDKAAVSEWSTENVTLCRHRQRRILSDVWEALKPGGILIYSTCTYNLYENEDNVEWIIKELGAEPLPVPVRPEWNITPDLSGRGLPAYRFIPHKTAGEGFFLAALRKTSDENTAPVKPKKEKREGRGLLCTVPPRCKEWIQASSDYEWVAENGKVWAYPREYSAFIRLLRQKLKVMYAGVEAGEIKGRDCAPSHCLAMSTALAPLSFARAELSYEQAIAYLRKESVSLPGSVSDGYVLLTYKNVPAGFVKKSGARSNNLYPSAWRIRSIYMPSKTICL